MSSSQTYESRRRLEQVWWAVLTGVLVSLFLGATAYFVGLPGGTAAFEPAPERAPSR
jgi:hypothetical protein